MTQLKAVWLMPHLPLLAASLVLTSCGDGGGGVTPPTPDTTVARVEVDVPSASLEANQTMQLTARAKNASGGELTGRVFTWTSSSTGTASVSPAGVVSGHAPGTVTITASADGKSGNIALSVTPAPVATLAISPAGASLIVGALQQLAATAKDAAGNDLNGRVVTWSSSTPAVASVDGSGMVSAVGVGTASITATSEGKSATAAITVIPVPVASVAVSPATASLPIGDTRQLTAVARDAQGNGLSGRTVAWSSSSSAVASVSAAGIVTAVAPGVATISATVENKVGSAAVTVFQPVTPVGGIVNSNTTWSRANSPYRLTENVQIAHGATLTIEPDVEVQGANKRIEVWGVLRASGTAAARVRLDSTHVVPRGTYEEHFQIRMEHVEMRRGSLYAPMGGSGRGNLQLRDSRLYDLGSYLYLWYPVGESFIERNVFVRSGGLSVGADTRTAPVRVYIRNNTFVEWATPYAVENWASYGGETTIVQHNSFLSTNRVALRLPSGYSDARLSAAENYWGTTSESVIQSMIYDRNDDLGSAGTIVYAPFLTQPHASTPAP